MNRRSFLLTSLAAAAPPAVLKCKADGTFTVLMISDLHYTPRPDEFGIALTEKLIAREKPDIVIVAGDCVTGKSCATAEEVRTAVGNVARAMENKGVPWAITFGNHDEEHSPNTGISKQQVMAWYEAYSRNLNRGWVQGGHGVGDKNILVWNVSGTRPVFNLWLVDSGNHTRNRDDKYDWIRPDQVEWYRRTSRQLEEQHGARIPGLMFFHIPLPEFGLVAAEGKFSGRRKENECPSAVNGGLFAAVAERGDVKGIFCGHDHVNTYTGNWKGVLLGYDGVAGYGAYPRLRPEDPANGSVRGGRIFRITESDPEHFRTWMRFQNDSVEG